MSYFKIVYESGSGKYVSLTSPSGFTSSKEDATTFMNLADFYDQTKNDSRYTVGIFESHDDPNSIL